MAAQAAVAFAVVSWRYGLNEQRRESNVNEKTPLDFWNERFKKEEYVFGTRPNAFLVSQAHRFAPGQRVLCVADGEGRNGVYLAGLGVDVLSIDFSPIALEKARRLADERGVKIETREVDLYAYDWPEAAFDMVAAIFIQFAPPEQRGRIFEGMKKCLKPGGQIVLQGYRPEQLEYKTGGPPVAENMYTAEMLREAFADMEILHLREHDSVIEEGPGHAGMSALVDMVARKR